MPPGQHIPNEMESEVVRLFYTCLKNIDNAGQIKFDEVAKTLGMPSAKFAKERLQRTFKAQEKTGAQPGHGGGKGKAVKREGKKGDAKTKDKIEELGSASKKRKLEAVKQEVKRDDGQMEGHSVEGSSDKEE